MLDHLALQCSDLEASGDFYDALLSPLGYRRMVDDARVVGYGDSRPSFWIGPHRFGEGFRESHIAFEARSRAAVDAFVAAAEARDAEVLHQPRVWPEYHPDYYAGFVRDPDGNNVEAVCHAPA
ncbi:MAG: VOC family protein [Actinobacteria bacterium]|nr:VOC family protein [Actinomycetota bacterium]